MTARSPLIVLFVFVASMVSPSVFAHKASDAYLTLRTEANNDHVLHGQWDIALRDLDFAISLDTNHDGAITWGEVQAKRSVIETYALSRLTMKGDGLTCAMHPTGQKISEHTDGAYAVLLFDTVCNNNIPSNVSIDYRLFAELDPYHRGIVTMHAGANTAGAVLGPQSPTAQLNLRDPSRWRQFKSFVHEGMWHIWTGFDHILFLFSLLLPAVLIRHRVDHGSGGSGWRASAMVAESSGVLMAAASSPQYRWEPVNAFWPAFREVIKVVSAFTVSHSLTLSLAVLGIVSLPSRLVEAGIALSVVVAALNNIYPMVTRRVWLVAFAFGFIHGLGFASALSGLQLPAGAMAASLGGFNIGVELGQAVLVVLFLPLAFAMRKTRVYRVGMLRWGSVLIVAIATGWLVQRAFNIVIPGFNAVIPG